MDNETLRTGLQILNMLGTFAVGVWLYLEKRNDKTNDRIDATNTAVTKLAEDTAKSIEEVRKSAQVSSERRRRECDVTLDDHTKRITTLETQIANAPNHDDLAGIYEVVNTVREDVGSLSGEFKGVKNLLDTIHQHLLRGAQ